MPTAFSPRAGSKQASAQRAAQLFTFSGVMRTRLLKWSRHRIRCVLPPGFVFILRGDSVAAGVVHVHL